MIPENDTDQPTGKAVFRAALRHTLDEPNLWLVDPITEQLGVAVRYGLQGSLETPLWQMVADVSTDERRTSVIDLLDEHLNKYRDDVDVPKEWNSFQQARKEKARNDIHNRLADKYGPGLRSFRHNEQSDNIATVLRDVQGPPPAIWGNDQDVLWSKGEALLIAAGIGAGKTTLAGLLVRAMLLTGEVLGQPVQTLAPGARVLYLALDRPNQIARSLARQFTAGQRDAVADRLVMWSGSLPADAAENPDVLKDIADYYDNVAVVIIDSLKDAATGLSEDRVAARYNEARKRLLESGRELMELHHLTKGGDDCGSVWLNAGAGSVIRLSGKAGAKLGAVTHVKQPAHPVGPLKVAHDRDSGEILLRTKGAVAVAPIDDAEKSLVEFVTGQSVDGATARDAALYLYGSDSPSDRERARYALDQQTGEDGPLYRIPGTRGGKPSRWVAVDECE